MSQSYHPKRVKKRGKGPGVTLPLLVAAAVVCVCLLLIPSAGKSAPPAADVTPNTVPTASPSAPVVESAPQSTPTSTPEPEATPTPEAGNTQTTAFSFTQPVPQSDPVDMDYFSDALFIGDSRTDGLQIYSGIKGATFYCYKGLNIFDMSKRQVVEMNGGKYTVVEALERGPQYAKIYISLGINELGYVDDNAFYKTFTEFLQQVKASQPDAVIYLQNLVPVNPSVCAAKGQPSYVNNDRVADYNAIFPRLAEEQGVVLLDVATALTDEDHILPADATADGVHFTKAWYQKWLTYLMEHTVDPEAYAAGQANVKGADEA